MITVLDLLAITVVCFFSMISFVAWAAINSDSYHDILKKENEELKSKLMSYRKDAYARIENDERLTNDKG